MELTLEICKEIDRAGGKPYFIGGWVRDKVMGIESKDIDIEVYGLDQDKLEEVLVRFGDVSLVGKQFGVYKLSIFRLEKIDISLPRTESKTGVGHTEFTVTVDPYITMGQAILRRDLTINSLFYNPLTGVIIDLCHGREDIKNKTLRTITADKFREDPLRVYRVMQFMGRLEFTPTEGLTELCTEIVKSGELDELSKERVYEEFEKLLLKSKRPSLGLRWALSIGLLEKYFPELSMLVKVEQDPQWHKEGDVFNHTMMALDAGAKLRDTITGEDEEELRKRKAIFMFGVLCHDLGKGVAGITEIDGDGTVHSRRHESAGEEPTLSFLDRITNDIELRKKVVFLVTNHMTPLNLYNSYLLGNNPRDSAFRRLGIKALDAMVALDDLLLLTQADNNGRISTVGSLNDGIVPWFNKRIEDMIFKGPVVPKPLITGDDLINDFGMKQSIELGVIKQALYDHQIENDIQDKEVMVEYLKGLLKEKEVVVCQQDIRRV